MATRRIVAAIASTAATGRCPLATPNTWVGSPSTSRRTIAGGVLTDSATAAAPCSTRSTAISAPEFPAPTTSTRRPRNGSPFR